jgi:hypothetical protein
MERRWRLKIFMLRFGGHSLKQIIELREYNFKGHGSFFLVPLAGLLDSPLDTTQLSALIEEYVLDPSLDESFDSLAPEVVTHIQIKQNLLHLYKSECFFRRHIVSHRSGVEHLL